MAIKIDVPKGRIVSGYVEYVLWTEALKSLSSRDFSVISAKENLELIMQEGLTPTFKHGNRVREAFIYFPNAQDKIILVKHSPALDFQEEYSKTHRDPHKITSDNFEDFHLTDEQLELALKYSVALKNTPGKACDTPTNRFGEDEFTSFLFGDSAKRAGEFLNDCGVSELFSLFSAWPCWFSYHDRPFLKQMHLSIVKTDDFPTPVLHIGHPEYFGRVFTRVRGIKYSKK